MPPESDATTTESSAPATVTEFLDQQFAVEEASSAEAEAPVAEPAAETAAAPAAETSAEQKVFDEQYVKELREEAAKYRTKYGKYRDAFEGFAEDEQETFLTLARELREAPESAAARMLDAARAIYGDRFADALEGNTGPKPLTQADLDAALEAREAERAQQQAIEAVISEARALGYEDDPNDPDRSADYRELMFRASTQFNGDLKAADKAVQDRKAAIVEKFLAEKAAKNEAFPTTSGGVAPAGEPAKSTGDPWKDARAGMEAMLAAAPGR